MKNSRIIVAFAVILASCSALNADSLVSLHREFEFRRAELSSELRAQRESARYEFHRNQDALQLAIKQTLHLDCPEARARQLRQIHSELSSVARDFGERNREISLWYHREHERLRKEFECARRRVRHGGPISYVERPLCRKSRAADCKCSSCRGASISGLVTADVEPYERGRPRHAAKRPQRRSDYDWAGLVLSLLLH